MQLVVISCKDSLLWYNKHIGDTFNVICIKWNVYWCREKNEYRAMNFIHKDDAKIINERQE